MLGKMLAEKFMGEKAAMLDPGSSLKNAMAKKMGVDKAVVNPEGGMKEMLIARIMNKKKK